MSLKVPCSEVLSAIKLRIERHMTRKDKNVKKSHQWCSRALDICFTIKNASHFYVYKYTQEGSKIRPRIRFQMYHMTWLQQLKTLNWKNEPYPTDLSRQVQYCSRICFPSLAIFLKCCLGSLSYSLVKTASVNSVQSKEEIEIHIFVYLRHMVYMAYMPSRWLFWDTL